MQNNSPRWGENGNRKGKTTVQKRFVRIMSNKKQLMEIEVSYEERSGCYRYDANAGFLV